MIVKTVQHLVDFINLELLSYVIYEKWLYRNITPFKLFSEVINCLFSNFQEEFRIADRIRRSIKCLPQY